MRRFLRMGAAVATLCWGCGAWGQTPPVPTNVELWVSKDDYPVEALRRAEQGNVGFELMVGVDGRVSGCAITATSGSSALDAATCALLTQRARFRPATDVQGRAVPGTIRKRIGWQLPTLVAEPLEPLWMTTTVVLDSTGAVQRCTSERGSSMAMTPPDPCTQYKGRHAVEYFFDGKAFGAGTMTMVFQQDVDAAPPVASRVPAREGGVRPFWTQVVRFSVDATGRAGNCTVRPAGDAMRACGSIGPFLPAPQTPKRHVLQTRSLIFQPAQ